MRAHRRSEPQRRERFRDPRTTVDCFPSTPRTMPFRATQRVHSSQPSCCSVVPFPAQAHWIDLLRCIQGSDSITVELHLLTSVFGAKLRLDVSTNGSFDLFGVIFDEGICQTHSNALLSAVNSPDERAIRGI